MSPMPMTTGVLRTNLADMQVGDYIVCKYVASSGIVGTFSELGTTTSTEISVTGSATPNGSFYFVKADKGLLIADRVIQHTITWDTLNAGKVIQGKPTTLGATTGIICSPTGGVAYADANGNSSTTDKGFGAFPVNNEWDKHIVNFPVDKIQSGKTLDDIFHWSNVSAWMQDTVFIPLKANTYRTVRGLNSVNAVDINRVSNATGSIIGFRPVFEWNEV